MKFTAFNCETGTREEFQCNYVRGIHDSRLDAATSHLWYGQGWSRQQLDLSDIQLEPNIPACDYKIDMDRH